MLITCPECELQVSDKACACPHCGYPMKSKEPQQRSAKPSKFKRLPNGFGQITKISNKNLRNPYRAMVTVGKTETGRPICKLLKPQAYFKTYNDAYAALAEYNKNPYDLEPDVTMAELYEKWSNKYFQTLKSDSSCRGIKAAWKYFENIKGMRVKDVRARHIKGCMDSAPKPGIKTRMKSVANLMLDYAVEYELVNINYARTFNISDDVVEEVNRTKHDHISFTDAELQTLWSNIRVPYVDLVLAQCYSGLRPQELGLIECKNVDLDNNIMIGGMKTEAGTDRVIPIHPAIKNIIEAHMGGKYLFDCEGTKMTYDKYAHRFENIIEALGLNPNHRPHDPRKTFVTLAKRYGVDEYAIKRIVGHNISDITEKVYTERDEEWLISEIEKIRVNV